MSGLKDVGRHRGLGCQVVAQYRRRILRIIRNLSTYITSGIVNAADRVVEIRARRQKLTVVIHACVEEGGDGCRPHGQGTGKKKKQKAYYTYSFHSHETILPCSV
jgi:hypothetical protein